MDTSVVKTILGVVAVILTFAGYLPYFRDIRLGKTVPHIYSWILWTLVTGIIFGLQYTGGAGAGAYVTLAVTVMCGGVLFLSFQQKVDRDVKAVDAVFLVLAFIALILWLVAKQPVYSTILSTLIDLLGFAPTIRKSWNNPYSETVSFYGITTFRFVITTLSLSQYTVQTALYPIAWIFGNGLFALMLLYRRRQVTNKS